MESALREGGRDKALRLIETLGWDGGALVRGERHLARLARSAARLGWECDVEAARAALLAGVRVRRVKVRVYVISGATSSSTMGSTPSTTACASAFSLRRTNRPGSAGLRLQVAVSVPDVIGTTWVMGAPSGS